MAGLGFKAAWDFGRAVAGLARGGESARSATVTSVDEDGTVWVRMAGAESDVPLDGTLASAQVGDTVTVGWIGGAPTASGNASDPAAGGRSVAVVHESVRIAQEVAQEAQAVANATGQHFFTDSNGIHVTETEGDATTGHNILINALGILLRKAVNPLVSITQSAIAFYDGLGSAAANIVARFGVAGFQVGIEGESHLVGDYHSLQLIDKDGGVYFYVSDLRDASGLYEAVDTFSGNGTKNVFYLTYTASSNDYMVKVDGAEVTSGITKGIYQVNFTTAPSDGAVVIVEYATSSERAKAYTLGSRASDSEVGAMSYAEGFNVTASGQCSHAEGSYTQSTHEKSHAEGISTVASGLGAHAEGISTVASGGYSHAQNNHTIAARLSQTALGTYNVEDTATTTTHPDGLGNHGAYALIVGNGVSENARSNAFAVRWDGTMEAAKPLPVASGGTGSKAYGTIVTEDISTAVSVPTGTSWHTLGSVALAAGDWIVSYNVQFDNNSTGRRAMVIHSAADTAGASNLRQGGVTSNAVSGGATYLNACRVLHLTSAATYYLNVYQTSGAALNTYGYIRAFRLK